MGRTMVKSEQVSDSTLTQLYTHKELGWSSAIG